MRWPCFLGIDIPEPDELIAHELDIEGIRERIGADRSCTHLMDLLGQLAATAFQTLHAALEERDVPVQLLVFDDEGHGIVKLKNKLVAYPAIMEFLNAYV